MMHIINNLMKILRLNLFSTIKCYIQYKINVLRIRKTTRTKVKKKGLSLTSKKTKLYD
jgi:hypothetical protein